jgi:hypothetical protein
MIKFVLEQISYHYKLKLLMIIQKKLGKKRKGKYEIYSNG